MLQTWRHLLVSKGSIILEQLRAHLASQLSFGATGVSIGKGFPGNSGDSREYRVPEMKGNLGDKGVFGGSGVA